MRAVIDMRAPLTHASADPVALVGARVQLRPFYYVPSGRQQKARSVQSEHMADGVVVDAFGLGMVVVAYQLSGPWSQTAAYYPSELHRVECRCYGCAPHTEPPATSGGGAV